MGRHIARLLNTGAARVGGEPIVDLALRAVGGGILPDGGIEFVAQRVALVGDGVVVGNSCELKNCILFDEVQTPHYNYVGDSVLGYKAHMGAGAVTSNVKGDKKNVVVHGERDYETGRKKFGAMLGDFAEIGCNSVLNPGTIIGRDSQVYPLSSVRGVVKARHIVKGARGAFAKD